MSAHWSVIAVAVAGMVLCAGSGRVADTARAKDRTTFEDIERQVRETLRTIRAYGFDHKDEYGQKLQTLLDKLDRQMAILKAKAARTGGEARKKYQEQLAELRPLRDKVRARMKKIADATPDAWEDVKTGVSAAVDDLWKSLKKARVR